MVLVVLMLLAVLAALIPEAQEALAAEGTVLQEVQVLEAQVEPLLATVREAVEEAETLEGLVILDLMVQEVEEVDMVVEEVEMHMQQAAVQLQVAVAAAEEMDKHHQAAEA